MLPVAPIRRMMMDTMSLGKDGGGRSGKQSWVIGVIDPSSKWAHVDSAPPHAAGTCTTWAHVVLLTARATYTTLLLFARIVRP